MSEGATPAVAGNAVVGAAQGLTPEAIEAVLADFRSWLEQLPHLPNGEAPPPDSADADGAAAIDLHTLLAQFIALRHEVNLQTRAVRNQQEQNAESLRQLAQAQTALGQMVELAQKGGAESRADELRPLLKTLVETADALALARREIRRAEETVLAALEELAAAEDAAEAPEEVATAPRRGFWTRLFGVGARAAHSAEAGEPLEDRLGGWPRPAEEVADQIQRLLESLISGYTMSLQRIERALYEHDLEPIACVGRAFDPEEMEVLEAVPDSGRPAGEVLEEVRSGYRWQGRVFRFALVRVAR